MHPVEIEKAMKVLELLEFFAALKGRRDGRKEAKRWLDELGLGEWANKKAETIQDDFGQDVVRLRLEDGEGKSEDLARIPEVEHVNDFGRLQELRLKSNAETQELLARVMDLGTVRHFELARPSLRDIFVRIAGPEAEKASDA